MESKVDLNQLEKQVDDALERDFGRLPDRITPEWVINNYLQNTEDKYAERYSNSDRVFVSNNFHEALSVYRDAVWREACEAQRNSCANRMREIYEITEKSPSFDVTIDLLEHHTRTAPIPEPKNPQV
jgi:hypothetical protein